MVFMARNPRNAELVKGNLSMNCVSRSGYCPCSLYFPTYNNNFGQVMPYYNKTYTNIIASLSYHGIAAFRPLEMIRLPFS